MIFQVVQKIFTFRSIYAIFCTEGKNMQKSNESNNLEIQSSHSGNKISSNQSIKDYAPNDITPKNADEVKNQKARELPKKKIKTTSKLVTTFVAMVSAVTIGAGGVTAIFAPLDVKASIESVFADETSVFCFVNVEEFADGLSLVLYNDFTNRVEIIEEAGSFEYYFENLAPHMSYTLEIKDDFKVYDSKIIITRFEEKQKPTDPITPVTDDSGLNEIEKNYEDQEYQEEVEGPTTNEEPFISDNQPEYEFTNQDDTGQDEPDNEEIIDLSEENFDNGEN